MRTPLLVALCCLMAGAAGAEVVNFDPGGRTADAFLHAARIRKANKNAHEPFVINGPCYSACTLTADNARPYTCVTPNASFHFHEATTTGLTGSDPPKTFEIAGFYSPDVRAWLDSRGGLPSGEGQWLSMGYSDSRKFFRECEPGEWQADKN